MVENKEGLSEKQKQGSFTFHEGVAKLVKIGEWNLDMPMNPILHTGKFKSIEGGICRDSYAWAFWIGRHITIKQ